jgi:hypothetical protein
VRAGLAAALLALGLGAAPAAARELWRSFTLLAFDPESFFKAIAFDASGRLFVTDVGFPDGSLGTLVEAAPSTTGGPATSSRGRPHGSPV